MIYKVRSKERVYYILLGVVYPTLKEALEALQGMR